ncbi:PREDICTED: inositol-pentakisphosphate 2-kinase [Nipponia nippon]|nr:PREDICTED: inositol-pentakisphosphate 2-kinase [Nipponia nippon]
MECRRKRCKLLFYRAVSEYVIWETNKRTHKTHFGSRSSLREEDAFLPLSSPQRPLKTGGQAGAGPGPPPPGAAHDMAQGIKDTYRATQTVAMYADGQASIGLSILFSLWYVFPPSTRECITGYHFRLKYISGSKYPERQIFRLTNLRQDYVLSRLRCVVLRFLKFPPNQNKTSEEILRHLQNIVDFGKHVMKQFFGENYVHHGEIIQLPLDFIRQLCLKVQPERPESRCDKDMDTLSGYAMCLPNLTRLQTYRFVEHRPILCIEIKPKCGFIPFSSHVSQEIKHKVCRYCMHQHLKVANGKWKRPSKYCPLDLFSGNKQRMHFALKSLLQEAQNNLKIFKNGELIYGCKDDQDCVSDWNELARHLKPFFFPSNGLVSGPHCTRTIIKELIHVITMTLLSSTDACRAGDMKTVPISQGRSYCEASAFNKELVRNGKHKLESSGLPRGCLLYKTLQAQMLDMLDIEGLYPLYSRVEQYLEEFPEERSTLQIDGPYNEAFYEKLLDLSTEDDGTVAFALTKVQQYRIAMTAKDCSIMIALSPCLQDECSEQRPVVLTSKSRFTFSVSVLDLDLKPYESIPHQYKLDGKIVNYYLKNVQAKDDPVMSSLFKENEDCTLVLHKV